MGCTQSMICLSCTKIKLYLNESAWVHLFLCYFILPLHYILEANVPYILLHFMTICWLYCSRKICPWIILPLSPSQTRQSIKQNHKVFCFSRFDIQLYFREKGLCLENMNTNRIWWLAKLWNPIFISDSRKTKYNILTLRNLIAS